MYGGNRDLGFDSADFRSSGSWRDQLIDERASHRKEIQRLEARIKSLSRTATLSRIIKRLEGEKNKSFFEAGGEGDIDRAIRIVKEEWEEKEDEAEKGMRWKWIK